MDVQRKTSLPGLWAAGDVVGGSPKKYAPGAWAEGVLAIRDMIEDVRDRKAVELDEEQTLKERDRVFAPFEDKPGTPPRELEERLQKVMDEYAGGISQMYAYSEGELKIAEIHLQRLEQEFNAISAGSLHELLHAHELMDRVTVAQTLVAHMLHRQETRWHCYQERVDYPERDDTRWNVFVNSVRKGDKIEMVERPVERANIEVVLPELADGAIIRHGGSQ